MSRQTVGSTITVGNQLAAAVKQADCELGRMRTVGSDLTSSNPSSHSNISSYDASKTQWKVTTHTLTTKPNVMVLCKHIAD